MEYLRVFLSEGNIKEIFGSNKFLKERRKSLSSELKTVAVVNHWHFRDGCESALVDYLCQQKVPLVYFLHHPFSEHRQISSELLVYEHGVLKKRKLSLPLRLPGFFQYFKDFFYSIFYGIFFMKKLDLFIGADCLNALAGWVLKKIGKVKKVVFYSIDYIPVRFKNPFLNFIYHLIDRFCVKHCDAVWNLTERMSKVRAKFAGASKQKVVPAGADLKNSYYYENPDLEKNSLVYMGSLSKNNGLDLAILAVAEIKKQFPDVCLRIIGHGPEEENLKELVKKEGLEKEVRFLGYIQERKKMFDIIARSYLALALYKPEGNKEEYMAKLSWFGGSAKVLDYLVCGTPVLITSVPEIALEIEKENAGILVDFEKDKIVEAVLELFKNPEKLFFLREKARLFALKKDWTKIFKEALYF